MSLFLILKEKITSRNIVLNCQDELFWQCLMDTVFGFSHDEFSGSPNPYAVNKRIILSLFRAQGICLRCS